MAVTPRRATPGDGAAVVALHNPVIRETIATFTDRERCTGEVEALIAAGQPHWLAEAEGAVLGFATVFPFRQGPGYARTFEHTVVVAPAAQGRGIGRALMRAAEAGVRAHGGHSLFAAVSGENTAGIGFHAALGYARVARLQEVGWKFGRFHDLVLMQKILSPDRPED